MKGEGGPRRKLLAEYVQTACRESGGAWQVRHCAPSSQGALLACRAASASPLTPLPPCRLLPPSHPPIRSPLPPTPPSPARPLHLAASPVLAIPRAPAPYLCGSELESQLKAFG